jgi:hypothetical protein
VTGTHDAPPGGGANRAPRTVITDAQSATSKDQASRQKRYTITMAFRTVCFVCMIPAPGALRWILFACAVSLPYIAVVLANQANTRTKPNTVERSEPTDATQITDGGPGPEIIPGTVVEDATYDQVKHPKYQQERRSA